MINFDKRKISFLHFYLIFGLFFADQVNAKKVAKVDFNSNFLDFGVGERLDLSKYSDGNLLEPGVYAYDVYVNDRWVGREDLTVIPSGDGDINIFCFDTNQIKKWGVNDKALPSPEEFNKKIEQGGCIDVSKLVPDITVQPVISDLLVRVTIPQAYVKRNARGYVSPENWQNGINAGYVNYSLNAYRTSYRDYESDTSAFGLINVGFNIGPWRLRNNSTIQKQTGSSTKYRSVNAYVQRDVVPLYSTLTLGQHTTIGRVFQSFPYTGFQLASSEMMLPDSQSGFAPVIRGTADTNAKVSVYQDGSIVYETSVTPGPFTIDDLSNTGVSGNLEVVVNESNGQIKRFTVPYASVVQLLRPGTHRFSLAAGRYRDRNLKNLPNFLEGTYQRGLSNTMSAYGGAIAAEDYYSAQLGLAFNTRAGAFSADVTHSDAQSLPRSWLNEGGDSSGQSYSLSYSKLLTETNTNLTLAAYRFSSRGYLNFEDFARARSVDNIPINNNVDNYYYSNLFTQKNRFQVSINQDLGRWGSLYVSGSTQNYWNSLVTRNTTYMLGYSKGFRWGQLTLNVSRYNNRGFENSTQTSVGVTIPLGSPGSSTVLSSSVSHSTNGDKQFMSTLSGRIAEGDKGQSAFYSVYGMHNNNSDYKNTTSGGGSIQYDGRYAQLSGNASTSSDGTKQIGLNLNGSIVAHSQDISFTRNQGDTFAIVHAPGAAGAVVNSVGVINENGFGIASNLYPYRENMVSIDPAGASLDVEVMGTSQNVAPTLGAIVYLEYETVEGKAVLLDVTFADGERPPLGASVLNSQRQTIAQIGQMGRAFLRGIDGQEYLIVSWGEGVENECQINLSSMGDALDPAEGGFIHQQVSCINMN